MVSGTPTAAVAAHHGCGTKLPRGPASRPLPPLRAWKACAARGACQFLCFIPITDRAARTSGSMADRSAVPFHRPAARRRSPSPSALSWSQICACASPAPASCASGTRGCSCCWRSCSSQRALCPATRPSQHQQRRRGPGSGGGPAALLLRLRFKWQPRHQPSLCRSEPAGGSGLLLRQRGASTCAPRPSCSLAAAAARAGWRRRPTVRRAHRATQRHRWRRRSRAVW
jgi:hypothetical protein